MDYIKAFIVGGIICALVQILMEKTKITLAFFKNLSLYFCSILHLFHYYDYLIVPCTIIELSIA